MSASPLPSTWSAHSPRFWILLAAVSTAIPAFIISGAEARFFLQIASGIAAGSSAALLWWLLIERPSKPTLLRGAAFGFLTNLLANPLAWLIYAVYEIVSGQLTAASEGVPLHWAFLQEVVSGSFLSLFFIGIITFPLAIILGLVLAALRRRTLRQGVD